MRQRARATAGEGESGPYSAESVRLAAMFTLAAPMVCGLSSRRMGCSGPSHWNAACGQAQRASASVEEQRRGASPQGSDCARRGFAVERTAPQSAVDAEYYELRMYTYGTVARMLEAAKCVFVRWSFTVTPSSTEQRKDHLACCHAASPRVTLRPPAFHQIFRGSPAGLSRPRAHEQTLMCSSSAR